VGALGQDPVDARPSIYLASLGIAVVVLTATATVASIAPASRAAHLDPVEALRVQ
jgi:ABC-type lipoprotein release transport system permease subunit